MLPGETVATGAPSTCSDCGNELELEVCRSGGGYFLGYFCGQHGQHSRETGYFRSEEEAKKALEVFIATGIMIGQRS